MSRETKRPICHRRCLPRFELFDPGSCSRLACDFSARLEARASRLLGIISIRAIHAFIGGRVRDRLGFRGKRLSKRGRRRIHDRAVWRDDLAIFAEDHVWAEALGSVLGSKILHSGSLLSHFPARCERRAFSASNKKVPRDEGLRVVAGVGFEPTVRHWPDYEHEERLKPVSLKNPLPRP
jgi:hypothetical protein